MGISKLFSSYSDENSVDNPIMSTFFNGTTTSPLQNLHETYYPIYGLSRYNNIDRGVNEYHRKYGKGMHRNMHPAFSKILFLIVPNSLHCKLFFLFLQ